MVHYIYKQIHKGNLFSKILYRFIETYFLTTENPYGKSLSLCRHTCIIFVFVSLCVIGGYVSFVVFQQWRCLCAGACTIVIFLLRDLNNTSSPRQTLPSMLELYYLIKN